MKETDERNEKWLNCFIKGGDPDNEFCPDAKSPLCDTLVSKGEYESAEVCKQSMRDLYKSHKEVSDKQRELSSAFATGNNWIIKTSEDGQCTCTRHMKYQDNAKNATQNAKQSTTSSAKTSDQPT